MFFVIAAEVYKQVTANQKTDMFLNLFLSFSLSILVSPLRLIYVDLAIFPL